MADLEAFAKSKLPVLNEHISKIFKKLDQTSSGVLSRLILVHRVHRLQGVCAQLRVQLDHCLHRGREGSSATEPDQPVPKLIVLRIFYYNCDIYLADIKLPGIPSVEFLF